MLDELFDHVLDWPPAARQATTDQPCAEGSLAAGRPAEQQPGSNEAQAKTFDVPTDLLTQWSRHLPGAGGVYLLTDAADRLIQLASTGHLRRAMRIRLQPHADPAESTEQPAGTPTTRRADLSKIVRKIRWTVGHSAFEITYLYWRIARVLLPETYHKQVTFGPSWFVHVDAEAEVPRFVVGKTLRNPPGVDLGPMATQADANRFVQLLEDGFDLCRYYHILQQAPHGQACPYFDMGKCPAPCDGSIPMASYREMIAAAARFAAGEREPFFADRDRRMRQAAADMAFERAAAIKQQIEKTRAIEHRAFALLRPIAEFNWLILQRGGGTTRIKPFFVHAGQIEPGETVPLKQIDRAIGDWLSRLRQSHGIDSSNEPDSAKDRVNLLMDSKAPQSRSEQIWLVSHFLFKKEPPGLFLHASQLPDAETLVEQIRTWLARPEKPTQPDSQSGPQEERENPCER